MSGPFFATQEMKDVQISIRTKSIADAGPAIHSFSVDETLGTEPTTPQGDCPVFPISSTMTNGLRLIASFNCCCWKKVRVHTDLICGGIW